jgi:outer membrane protein assembly factor BamA
VTSRFVGLVFGALCLLSAPRAEASARSWFHARDVIAEIRVHGNQIATDAEVVALSGAKVGDAVDAQTTVLIAARLRAAGRFDKVDVLKRFASIDDPSQIVIVIVVDEGPVNIELSKTPGGPAVATRRRGLANVMFLPILDSEDGYGFTYGARFAFPRVGGSRARLSFPVSWGGERQVGAEFEKNFVSRAITRVEFGGGFLQRTNPYYTATDARRRGWGRVERAIGPLRLGATGGRQRVDFQGETNSFWSAGADVTFDTRLDPFLARNAVYASAKTERLFFARAPTVAQSGTVHPEIDRHSYEARGYLGFIGQSVLVVRVLREDASAPLPPYLASLLGGVANLRGFDAGTAVGDTLVAGSAELRVPLTMAVNVAKVGVSAFVDTGAVYNFGQRLSDQERKTGIGGAVWVTAAALHLSLSVAHGLGAHTRVLFDIGLGF